MEVQLSVLEWLAVLPFILAAFRAITIGDRLFASTVTGRAGGETSAQTSLLRAGLSVFAMLIAGQGAGSGGDSIGLALIVLAFGGFLLSHYMLMGFRAKQWQGFLGAAVQEAALYWLMLGVIRSLFVAVGDASKNTEFFAAGWIVIVGMSVALIMGTFSRMFNR